MQGLDLVIGRSLGLAAWGLGFAVLLSCAPSQTRPEPRATVEPGGSESAASRTGAVEAPPESPSEANARALAPRDTGAASTRASRGAGESPSGAFGGERIWRIDQFGATPADALGAERAFYAALREAWLAGDEPRAFDLVTEELRLRPYHRELRILRAGVTLSGVGAGTLPLRVLAGESGGAADIPVPLILFVVAEFQRGIPELPPAVVPWTGLYHPYVFRSLLGSYVSLWSHGLRPLLRGQALIAGEIGVFEDFAGESPSLVARVLTAQSLAARGDLEGARETLAIRLEEHVAEEYVLRWRALLRALDASLGALGVVSAREARSLLAAWETQVRDLIPESSGALLTLPLPALERIQELREGRARERPVTVLEAEAVGRLLERRRSDSAPDAPDRGAPGPDARDPGALNDEPRADRLEMVEAFLEAAKRLRDFRADSLARVRSGDTAGILSRELIVERGLVFAEDRRPRVRFDRGGGGAPDTATDTDAARGVVIPCGGGAWVWVAGE